MKKKFLLAFLFLFTFLLFPKNTDAMSITAYGSNYSVVGSCTNCTSLYATGRVYSIYLKYDDVPLTPDTTYRLETTFNLYSMTSSPSYVSPVFSIEGVNQNISQRYYQVNSNNVTSPPQPTGYRINVGYIGDFTASRGGTGVLEIPFSGGVLFNGIEVTTKSFSYQGSSVTDAIGVAGNNIISNSNQNTQNIINNNNANTEKINNTLNDDNTTGASSEASDFFNNFSNNDHGLTGIITSPLRLINAIGSSSCSPLTFPLPFVNKNVTLPCMSTIYQTHFSTFLQVYQIITTGLIAYWVCVKIFQKVKSFKDPSDDKVEVFDL